jgi:hypothetical protein
MKASSGSYSTIVHFYIRTGLLLVVRCLILSFDIAYKTQQFLHLKEKPCFLSKLQIAPNALSKSTDDVYRKGFPPNPLGIFEIAVHCESHSMCR